MPTEATADADDGSVREAWAAQLQVCFSYTLLACTSARGGHMHDMKQDRMHGKRRYAARACVWLSILWGCAGDANVSGVKRDGRALAPPRQRKPPEAIAAGAFRQSKRKPRSFPTLQTLLAESALLAHAPVHDADICAGSPPPRRSGRDRIPSRGIADDARDTSLRQPGARPFQAAMGFFHSLVHAEQAYAL